MQPPMLYTGQKPVDPLIVNVWPLEPGASSSYSVYEDSGVSVEYQRGVFARTPIQADAIRRHAARRDRPCGRQLSRHAEDARLRAAPSRRLAARIRHRQRRACSAGRHHRQSGGWTFEGNTLTTVIPVPAGSVAAKVVIEVRRAAGLTARRAELDGFAGAMTRLRGAYDALQQTWPVSAPPDALIDAMQTGDRLGYHPERAVEEIAHFHEILPQAQTAVSALDATFAERMKNITQIGGADFVHLDVKVEEQRRLDLLHRAESLLAEAGK